MTRHVLLVRPDHNEADATALHQAGWEVIVEPWLEVRPVADAGPATALAARMAAGDCWLAVTSPRTWPLWERLVGTDTVGAALERGLSRGLRIAAVGEATARTLPAGTPVEIPEIPTAQGLVAHMLGQDATTLLLPGSTIARDELGTWAEATGWQVHRASVYETAPLAEAPTHAATVSAGGVDAVVLRSPSAARAVALFAAVPDEMMVVAVGPTTAAAARSVGGRLVELPVVTAAGLAEEMERL